MIGYWGSLKTFLRLQAQEKAETVLGRRTGAAVTAVPITQPTRLGRYGCLECCSVRHTHLDVERLAPVVPSSTVECRAL